MKKRLLSAILSFCMLLTMAPTVAFAAEDDEGTERNRLASSRTTGAPVRHAHRRDLRSLLGRRRLGEKATACTA